MRGASEAVPGGVCRKLRVAALPCGSSPTERPADSSCHSGLKLRASGVLVAGAQRLALPLWNSTLPAFGLAGAALAGVQSSARATMSVGRSTGSAWRIENAMLLCRWTKELPGAAVDSAAVWHDGSPSAESGPAAAAHVAAASAAASAAAVVYGDGSSYVTALPCACAWGRRTALFACAYVPPPPPPPLLLACLPETPTASEFGARPAVLGSAPHASAALVPAPALATAASCPASRPFPLCARGSAALESRMPPAQVPPTPSVGSTGAVRGASGQWEAAPGCGSRHEEADRLGGTRMTPRHSCTQPEGGTVRPLDHGHMGRCPLPPPRTTPP